jgi:PAS domain S-box-containing protein
MKKTKQELQAENDELRARLEEAEETLNAIRSGEVDALIVGGKDGQQIYTLTGADRTYRLLLESMCEGAVMLNPDGFIIYCNNFFSTLLKTPLEKLIGARLLDFIPKAEKQHFASLLAPCDMGETTLQAADRTLVPVYLSANMLPSEPGQQLTCVIVTDLRDQKRDEKIIIEGRLSKIIFDNAPEALIVCDEKGKIIRASISAHALCGQNPLDKPFDELFPLTLERGKHFAIAQALIEQQVQSSEASFLRRDGAPFILLLISAPLFDENDKLIGCMVTLSDITAHKQAEEALALSEREFRLLAESMPQIVWTTRADGWNTYFNNKWVDYTGLTLEESYGHGWNIPFHPDDQQRAWAAWQNAVLHNAPYLLQCRLRRADGVYRWWLVHGVPVVDENGTIIKWYGTCTDIEDMKQAEEALRDSEALLRDVIATVADPLYVKDAEGRLTLVNPATVAAVGKPLEQIIGHADREFYDDPVAAEAIEEHDRRVMQSGTIHAFEETVPSPTGYRVMLNTKAPRRDSTGLVVGLVGVARDITDRKQAEEELKKRTAELENANRDLESFSYSVSHDLQSPLHAINGFTAMILKDQGGAFDEDTRRKFDVIRENTKKMGQLIEDLLNFSRVGRKALHVVLLNMGDLVRDVWHDVRQNNPERIMTLDIRDIPAASGDRALIHEVYMNLIGNAVKFTKHCAAAHIEAGGYTDGNENVYYIRDNGAGFDMAYYEKLFGVFQRLHSVQEYEGSGIGLTIVQRIIQKHGGRVRAEGREGEGATFYFTLPRE